MDFPAYVPAAVRTHITTLIEGDKREPQGWTAALASAEHELSEIEQAIEARTARGEVEYLDSLRQQRADAVKHRDMLAGTVNCVLRLARDDRMREAFALLTSEFSEDEQWRGFVYAAWAASRDYRPYRERLKRAAELKEEIANAADSLAKLLRQFAKTGVSSPGEFDSVPALLRKTDNHELHGHNLHMWQLMRPYVLGERPRRDVSDREQVQLQSEGDSASLDPTEQAWANLCYGWEVSPSFSELLDTMARAARDFKPTEYGMVGAATKTRQRSEKTEYLRAFGNLLTEVHHIALTIPVMKAMAIVANVAINLPDVDVTNDDVRKALAKLAGEPGENSGKK